MASYLRLFDYITNSRWCFFVRKKYAAIIMSVVELYGPAPSPSAFTDLLGIGSEQYCRFLWSKQINDKKGSAWQAIGHRQSGKAVTSLIDFKMRAQCWLESKADTFCSVDVFTTPNEFFDWRNSNQLANLHANWLEIDTVSHSVVSVEEQAQIFDSIFDCLVAAGLPAPTAYVASGSGGFHLYWIYSAVPAFKWRVRIWREITIILARKLKASRTDSCSRWKIDFGASRDPARVMRLPGTYHSGSGRLVSAFTGGPVYSFDSLARSLISSKLNLAALDQCQSGTVVALPVKYNSTRASPPLPDSNRVIPNRPSIGQWWFKTYAEVCTTARRNGVAAGKRDLFAFILFVALCHIKKDKKSALDAVLALNHEFIHLDDEILRSYLKTGLSKHYKYRKDTLAEYLDSIGVDSTFLYQPVKAKLTKSEITARQVEAAAATAAKRRDKSADLVKAALNKAAKHISRVSHADIAKECGLSISTVKRVRQRLQTNGSLAVPVYIPPKQEPMMLDGNVEAPSPSLRLNDDKPRVSGSAAAKLPTSFGRLYKSYYQTLSFVETESGISASLRSKADIERICRVVLSFKLDLPSADLVVCQMANNAVESGFIGKSIDDWCKYVASVCRKIKKEDESRVTNLYRSVFKPSL